MILIVAGPNGAGKTTFAREFLPQEAGCPAFVNADLIAEGLSPFDPTRAALRAGRLMLQLMAEHIQRGDSFAFETTLAGRNYARSIPGWRAADTGSHCSSYLFHLLRSPYPASPNVSAKAAMTFPRRSSSVGS